MPAAKTYAVYDDALKGFGCRVMPSGAKSWIVEYRPGGGGRNVPKSRLSLGGVGTLTLDEARRAARDLLATVRLGGDPAGERSKQRQVPTFAEFADRYLKEEAETKLKPRTVANYRTYLRNHAVPRLGTIKLNKISTNDISKLHREVGRDRAVTANRVIEAIGSLYRYASACGLVQKGTNPSAGIQAYRESGRERYLTTDELTRFGEALREAETTGIEWQIDRAVPSAKHIPKKVQRTILSQPATGALRLLLFTGCRLREILHLRWADIDFERGVLLLPDSKTGRRYVILNAPALAVLTGLPRIGEYVIAGENPNKPRADLKGPWRAISRRAGLVGVRLHDLRHTHASIGAGAGLGLPVIGKLLGHATPTTTSRYAHLDNDPLRRASEQIGARLSAAVSESRTANNLVQINPARRVS